MRRLGMTLAILIIQQVQVRKKQQRDKVRKRLWARKWLQRRDEGRGIASMVCRELRFEDPTSFKNYTRMSVETFECLLQRVGPYLARQNTVLRESIPATSR